MESRADKRNLAITYCTIAVLMAVPALLAHTPHTVDEMGFLAQPAYFAGYDWTYAVHQVGDHYYKYGVTLFYLLPYMLVKDPIILYRVMLAINGLAVAASGIACYLICRRHLKVESANGALLMSLASTMIPSVLFQSLYCRADFVLVFTPWLVLLFLLEAYRSENRRKICFSVLCALTAVFAFMSHTRGVVLVIALFMTVVGVRLLFRIRTVHMPAYLGATAGGLLLDRILTVFFRQTIWKYGTAQHASIAGTRFADMRTIFTLTGLKVFLKTVFGWFYTIFSSSMGIVCAGIVAAVLLLFYAWRKKQDVCDEIVLTGTLGLLNFAGSMAMGILFFYPYLYESLVENVKGRFDRVFFERYMVGALGVLCLVALYVFFVHRDLFRKLPRFLSFAFFAVVLAVFCRSIAVYLPKRLFVMKYASALNIFSRIIKDKKLLLISAGVFALFLFALFLLSVSIKRLKWLPLVFLFLVYLGVYSVNIHDLRLAEDKSGYAPLRKMYEQIKELDVDPEEFPYIYFDSKPFSLKRRQPLFKDYQTISKSFYTADITDLLIVTAKTDLAGEEYADAPIYRLSSADYTNQKGQKLYVKGERLKEYLIERGISLEECVD